ncbi:carbohydrate porin [Mangrovitalea sediminis]|uniref:carbohydrate porin n=1 Tax=Mangrovitalea sediminis TaxID=1982043 RepID=UPI000BE5B04B|nr:carbohydrate porin [Mangrovitalea sediminis]
MQRKRLCRSFSATSSLLVFNVLAGLTAANAATLSPGVDVSLDFAQDYFNNVSGGAEHGSGSPSALHLTTTVDSRALQGSGNDVVHLDVLGLGGTSISARVGDLQGLDNNEATNTVRVFEAWYQHDFKAQGLSVRLGVQDYNALFDTLDSAGLFINSSFGLDPSVGQVGLSTFPESTLGGVMRWQNDAGIYVMGGVYDGTPGLAGHPYGTHVEWRQGDGTFINLEAGVQVSGDDGYKLGVGAWHRDGDFEDPKGNLRNSNQGLYFLGEKHFSSRYLGVPFSLFTQLGGADASRNTFDHYMGAGMTFSGLVPGRPDDTAGFGIARVHLSNAYRDVTAGSTQAETAYELTYQAVFGDHFSLQPDIQYIQSPGALSSVDDAWVVGARAEVTW